MANKRMLTGLLLLTLVIGSGFGQQFVKIRVLWDPNTETDLDGYRVYWGNTPRAYSNVDIVGNTTAHEKNINSQVKAYFAVTAYDQSGNESEYSNEAVYYPGMTVVDTVILSNSYICVQLRNTIGFNWRVYSTINGQELEINSLDSSTCLVLPVLDNWVTVTYHVEVTNLDGEVTYQTSDAIELPLTGDFNNDGRVGLFDLNIFAACYRNTTNYALAADYNRNNQNDLYDFYRFAQRYGRTK